MERLATLTLGDSLNYSALKKIRYYMKFGGYVIIPSDTGFSLACLPFQMDYLTKLCILLGHEKDPIPLSFGTLKMMEKYVEITAKDERIIDELLPGPLTLVCKIKKDIPEERRKKISEVLHSNGTIGVRLSDSSIERQISSELESPITTCAIRDDNGNIIQKFDDAVDIVRLRQEKMNSDATIVGVAIKKVKYEHHSTVITVQKEDLTGGSVHIYRHGEVAPEIIFNCIRKLTWSDYEHWT